MVAFFISNQMSPYYRSKEFMRVMEKLAGLDRIFEFSNRNGKNRLISRNVDSIRKAKETLQKLL